MMIDYELYPHSVAILCSNSWKGTKKSIFFTLIIMCYKYLVSENK